MRGDSQGASTCDESGRRKEKAEKRAQVDRMRHFPYRRIRLAHSFPLVRACYRRESFGPNNR